MLDANALHSAVAAVCPIWGIAIGREDDRSTWSLDPRPEATEAEIGAGEGVLSSWQPSSPAPSSATRLGIKRALEARGLWPAVRGAIAANPVVQEEWELATELFPTDPLVVGMVDELIAIGVPIDVPTLLIEAAAAVTPPPA